MSRIRHDNRLAFLGRIVMYDEELATGIPATTIVEYAFASHVIAKSDCVMVGFECDQVCAVNAPIFNPPCAKEDTVRRTTVVSLVDVDECPQTRRESRRLPRL
jgi:hypothetical protein